MRSAWCKVQGIIYLKIPKLSCLTSLVYPVSHKCVTGESSPLATLMGFHLKLDIYILTAETTTAWCSYVSGKNKTKPKRQPRTRLQGAGPHALGHRRHHGPASSLEIWGSRLTVLSLFLSWGWGWVPGWQDGEEALLK